MAHLQELSQYYDYLEPICLEIAEEIVDWHKTYGDPNIEARYLVETAYRIVKSPIYKLPRPIPNIDLGPIDTALSFLELLRSNLEAFLEGSISGSEIIRRGEFQLWDDFNKMNPLMDIFSNSVAERVIKLANGKKILELGGGVGGTTLKMSDSLTSADEFHFTDIKKYFLDNIRNHLSPEVNLHTHFLDLKNPPDDFDKFDIIYATNVVHVTSDIETTMKWIFDHLRPKGYIILGEGSPYSKSDPWPLELMFSLFKGWWNILRFEHRPYPGWLLPEQWMRFYSSAGFRKLDMEIFMDEKRLFGGLYISQKVDH